MLCFPMRILTLFLWVALACGGNSKHGQVASSPDPTLEQTDQTLSLPPNLASKVSPNLQILLAEKRPASEIVTVHVSFIGSLAPMTSVGFAPKTQIKNIVIGEIEIGQLMKLAELECVVRLEQPAPPTLTQLTIASRRLRLLTHPKAMLLLNSTATLTCRFQPEIALTVQ
jgi:hypothetical protein